MNEIPKQGNFLIPENLTQIGDHVLSGWRTEISDPDLRKAMLGNPYLEPAILGEIVGPLADEESEISLFADQSVQLENVLASDLLTLRRFIGCAWNGNVLAMQLVHGSVDVLGTGLPITLVSEALQYRALANKADSEESLPPEQILGDGALALECWIKTLPKSAQRLLGLRLNLINTEPSPKDANNRSKLCCEILLNNKIEAAVFDD